MEIQIFTLISLKVRRDRRLKLEGTDLQIRRMESDDAGEYVCEIETDDDEPIAIMHSVEILGESQQLVTTGHRLKVVFASSV